MDDLRSEYKSRIDWSWFDLEFLAYAIGGLVVIALGVRALARVLAGEWAAGGRLLPAAGALGASAIVAVLLFTLRSQKRWLYLGTALTVVALATAILSSAGVTVPASWLK
jgi:hypothetical protein